MEMTPEDRGTLDECLAIIRALITVKAPVEYYEAHYRAHAMLAKMGVEE